MREPVSSRSGVRRERALIITRLLLQGCILILMASACFYSLKPLIGAVYLASGNFYLEKKMLYLALDNYLAGLVFDPQNPELHQRAGLLFLDLSEQGKNRIYVAQGLAELRLAGTLTGDPVADYRLGLGYQFAGDSERSSFYFRRASVRSAGTLRM